MNNYRIIKMAFLLAVPLYVGVGWMTSRTQEGVEGNAELAATLFPLLAIVFLAHVLLEPFVTRSLMKKHDGYTKEAMIIKLAFYESGAIFGLVLTFLSHDVNYVLSFGMVAAALILFRVPLPEK